MSRAWKARGWMRRSPGHITKPGMIARRMPLPHVGWGMNPIARWDAMTMYDRTQINGTELRAFAGNFLYSTGANETAGRFTACHFDFPMRNCTIDLDGKRVVERGQLCEELR